MRFLRIFSPFLASLLLLSFNISDALAEPLAPQGTTQMGEEYSLAQLGGYYAGFLNQSIHAKPASEGVRRVGLSNLSFDMDPVTQTFIVNQKLAISPDDRISLAQGLFELDVANYNAALGGHDFLDSKTRFYSKLSFDLKTQKHERPFYYLADWLSLNHPPVTQLTKPLEAYASFMGPLDRSKVQSRYFSPEFQNEIDQYSGTELTRGNQVKALFNGDAISEKTRLIRESKNYFFGAVMTIACDESSEDFVQALIDKAQSGVDVRLIMESFYAHTLFRPCFNRLKRGGVDVLLVSDKLKLKSLTAFMHNKFWIKDGEEGIIGGQNIIKFENLSDGVNHLNRDTDLLMRGPAVADLLENFIDIWRTHQRHRNGRMDAYYGELERLHSEQRAQGLRGNENYTKWLSDPATRMGGVCRVLIQRPRGANFSIGEVYRKYLEAAQTEVVMTSPKIRFTLNGKFKPKKESDWFYQSVRQAGERGVRVDVVSNGLDGGDGELSSFLREKAVRAEDQGRERVARRWRSILTMDSQNIAKANRRYLKELQETPQIHAWTHFQYIHAKQVFFDRIAVSIGSVNLERSALDSNHEGTAVCMDQALSEQMDRQLTQDLVNSVPVISRNEAFQQGYEPDSAAESVSGSEDADLTDDEILAREAMNEDLEQDVTN